MLRDRANGLPREVAAATVTRPTARTVYLRFAQSAIGRPASVRFAAEAVTRARPLPAAARLPRHRARRAHDRKSHLAQHCSVRLALSASGPVDPAGRRVQPAR